MYKVIPTKHFGDNVEYYIKKKRFVHIAEDIKVVVDELEQGNLIGDEIPNLKTSTDDHTFKVRTINTDTKGGKSNGYRIIYYAIREDLKIYLLTIYYKKDDKKIPTTKELVGLIEKYCL